MEQSIKETAFWSYITKVLKRKESVNHIRECLMNGEPDNEAWRLMEEGLGQEWRCSPSRLDDYINLAINNLENESEEV